MTESIQQGQNFGNLQETHNASFSYTAFMHKFVIFTYILCHVFVTSKRPNVTNDIFIYVFTDLL